MITKIAFVDDEEAILRALKRLFFGTEYDCYLFNKPQLFLDFLEQDSVDILFSDIRMPEMNGIELMKKVKAKRPEIIRVALSGYTDSRQILSALDSGLARLYIYKPWENDELLKLIRTLVDMSQKLHQTHLMQAINDLGSLPTFSNYYQRIVHLIEQEASANEIADAIEKDPAITAKLLRIANTAFYGSHTGSVQHAIMLLGLTNVRQIILTNSIFESAEKVPFGKALWKHAELTNKGVAYLYQKCYKKNLPIQVGVVGLMHTIGLIFIATSHTEQYVKLIKQVEHQKQSGEPIFLEDLEQNYFGATHTEIGSFLLNWWELPFEIIESTYYYRHPSKVVEGNRELIGMVHYVSYLVYEKLNLTEFQHVLDTDFLGSIRLTQDLRDDVERFIQELIDEKEA